MALHRDIYWVGRQWAVTGSGIQACDQKQKGQFDIEAARLWEDGVLEGVRALKWLNNEDFEKAISVARKYYPEPARKARPPEVNAAQKSDGHSKESVPQQSVPQQSVPKESLAEESVPIELAKEPPNKEPPKPAVRKFELRIEGPKAKLLPVWRIGIRVGDR
jgi:hypothetical protein